MSTMAETRSRRPALGARAARCPGACEEQGVLRRQRPPVQQLREIWKDLVEDGEAVGHKRVVRLMQEDAFEAACGSAA